MNCAHVSSEKMSYERYRSVDLVKGICILFVIITHYQWRDSERLAYMFPFWIDMAVPLFMIISGFVYAKSYQKSELITFKRIYSSKNILKHIARFSVPFGIVFVFQEIILNILGDGFDLNVFQLVEFFLRGGSGPGSYYYPIMLQFVFYFPILFITIRKFKRNGLIICAFINLAYESIKCLGNGISEGCYRLLIFRYTFLIAYGCYLAMETYKRSKILSVILFLLGFTYIIIFRYMGVTPLITTFWTGTSMWAGMFIIPISSLLILNKKIKNRTLEALGKASYNIFLIQMIYYNYADIVYNFVQNVGLRLFINVVVCSFAGLIFYHVETPITQFLINKTYLYTDKTNLQVRKVLNK